jgi:hypothetical protein
MPDGSNTPHKRGWLIRKMVLGESLVIAQPDRPMVTLTLGHPVRSLDHKTPPKMAFRTPEGVSLHIPRDVAVEVAPGVVIVPRARNALALRSDDIGWTRFVKPAPTLPDPIDSF